MQLIANPEKYDGAEARLTGFLKMDRPDREVGFLYLDKENADRWLGTVVEVLFTRCDEKKPLDPLISVTEARQYDAKYVGLIGRFVADRVGPTRVGVVCDITRFAGLEESGQPRDGEPVGAGAYGTTRRP